jgi:hypothetical protein
MGTLTVKLVGVIRSGTANSRVLVQALDGLYYTWKVPGDRLSRLQNVQDFQVSSDDLEMATEQQVLVGRNNRGAIHAGSVRMEFHGLIQRGKINYRVLVSEPGKKEYFTADVPVMDLPERGGLIEVDRRGVFDAREDQVAAGLGTGKLRRNRRG